MSTWKQILKKPQQNWLRKLLFQVHLWVGIGLGLYVVLIGVTGAALVFREEIEHAMEKPLVDAAGLQGPRADLLTVADRIRAAYPDRKLTSIVNPRPEHATIRGFLRDKREKSIAVDAHPVTGQLLGVHQNEGSFLRWLADLHFNLLSGRTGRTFNGLGAAFLLVLCLTGIVIWWPGIKNWRRALSVDFTKKWKRVNWDLHSATGFWSAAVLAMWAVTGIYFAWPTEFRAAVNWFSPVSLAKVAKPDVASKGKVAPPDVQQVLAEAQRRSPNAELLSISFPVDDKGYLRVFLGREKPLRYDTADYHYFDPFTGKHLGVWQRGVNQSAGDVVMAWIGPLHFGTFGGEGMAGVAVKVLWVILGLAPPVLAISGFLMYWNRYLSKRWAKLKGSARERELAPASYV
ncbi:MAG: PepSY-associated TM helix domain-containing protein [Bryobacter sp.]